jgi:hypothetical protein
MHLGFFEKGDLALPVSGSQNSVVANGEVPTILLVVVLCDFV